MTDAKSTGSTAETAVCNQCTFLAHVHALDIRRGVQHLLHARTSLGTFVRDDDTVTFLYLAAQDTLAGILLRVKHDSRTFEMPQLRSHTCRLYDTSVLGNVTEQHSHAAISGIGMLYVANTTVGTVCIQCLPFSILRAHLRAEPASGSTAVYTQSLGIYPVTSDAIPGYILTQRCTVHTLGSKVQQAAFGQLSQNTQYTAGAVFFLDTVFLPVGSQLAQEWHLAAEGIDILHCKVNVRLLGDCQQMQNRIGACTHGNVQCHCIQESLACSDGPGQYAVVSVAIILPCIFHQDTRCIPEQLNTVDVCCQDTAVAGKGQAYGLGKRVHAVCREHTAAGSAARACTILDFCQLTVTYGLVAALYHGSDQVRILALVLTGLHRTSANEYRGNVKAHARHQHTWSNLVAVADANHSICLMGIDHILYAVRDYVTAGQAIQHTIMPHGNTIVHGYCVEFSRIASHSLYLGLDYLTYLMQMSVSRYKLGKTVYNGNNRLAKLFPLHSSGNPQRTCTCHTATLGAHSTP